MNEKKSQKIERTEVFTIKKAKGTVSFRKKSGSSKLSIDGDGNITVKKGTKPGAYQMTVIVSAGGNRNYKKGQKTVTVKVNIKKAAQPMTVKAKKVTLRYSKTKRQKIRRADAFSIRNAKGTVTFEKTGGCRNLSINRYGRITAKKGIKKGTHKIKVAVTAGGNECYKRGKKTVVVKVKVK